MGYYIGNLKKTQVESSNCLKENNMKRNNNTIMKDFLNLSIDLSPENLTCDGELSKKEVNKRYGEIRKNWSKLEKEIEKNVTEDEVWNWSNKQKSQLTL